LERVVYLPKPLVAFFALVVLGSAVLFGVIAGKADHEAQQWKDKYFEAQNNYEGTRDQLASVEKALADRDERLAQAAERERAAKVRASRSRASRTSTDVSERRKDMGVPTSGELFAGGLRDITKYCPTGNTTASGKWPRVGMVATLSRSIPFGTHILIEGLGEFVVEDRIGHGSEFDIFTSSCAEARRFGRQHRRVTIMHMD
jgi:3D (Asp-Asp-Asp) domain-containing protein